jgi:mRNA interferase HigB
MVRSLARRGRAIQAVHIISRKTLKAAALRHPDAEAALDTWYHTAKHADWQSLTDVRRTYPQADAVGTCTVFNIRGHTYRLIVWINYRTGRIYIRRVLTHAEYDREGWKHDCA